MPLTQTLMVNAQPREKMYRLSDGSGLYLEVTPQGGKLVCESSRSGVEVTDGGFSAKNCPTQLSITNNLD